MFSKIRGMIFEDDPNAPKPIAQPKQPAASQSSQASHPIPTTPNVTAPAVVPYVDSNNEFIAVLREAIRSRHSAYNSLLAAADKLKAILPDPTTRFRAAYATIAGEGRNPQSIVESIRIHQNDLQAQRGAFEQQAKDSMQKAIGAKRAELNNIDPSVSTLQQQIDALQQQISQLQGSIHSKNERRVVLQSEIAQDEAKFHAATERFNAALATVSGELEAESQIIQTALH